MSDEQAVRQGRIVRYHFVCNRFVKAYVALSDDEGVYCLVPKQDGSPIYSKGSTVAYIDGPLREYKGHQVRGEVKLWSEYAAATAEDIENAADWGLT